MGNFFSELFGKKEEEKKETEENKVPETEPERKPKPDVSDDLEFAQACLEAHNKYRAKHGAKAMTLNNEMCKGAQKWADKLAAIKQLKHSDEDLGENLAMMSGDMTAEGAVDLWYDEVEKYNFSSPGFTSGTGHFTQVVWKGSEEFGCAFAKTDRVSYIVGRYKPAGNVQGHFEANVLPK